MTTIDDFPWTVVESPRPSFKNQCMQKMRVLSKEQGVDGYKGPARVCHARWKHTSTIYILDPNPNPNKQADIAAESPSCMVS